PIADSAVIPTFFISRAASRDVRVVIAGEGADELFGGYYQQRLLNYAGKLYHREEATIDTNYATRGGFLAAKVASLASPWYSFPERYINFYSVFVPEQVHKLAPRFPVGESCRVITEFLAGRDGSTLGRILRCDSMTRM